MIFDILIRHKSIPVCHQKRTLHSFDDQTFEVKHLGQTYQVEVGFGARAVHIALKRLTGTPLERAWLGPLQPGRGKYRLAAAPNAADYHWTCWVTLVDDGRPIMP